MISGDVFDAVRQRQAYPKTVTSFDIASAVAFLVSKGAAAMNGQTLCVDGGFVLR